MNKMQLLVSLLSISICLLTAHPLTAEDDDLEPGHYVNSFLVDVDRKDLVDLVRDHGFEFAKDSHRLEELGLYQLQHKDVERRSKRSAEHHVNRLKSDHRVRYAEQQQVLDIEKREILHDKQEELPIRDISDPTRFFRVPADHLQSHGFSTINDNPFYMKYNDPRYKDCWFLNNWGQTGGTPGMDLHVSKGWYFEYNGSGIRVLVLDDGLDHTHPDLKDNYDPLISTDLNSHQDEDNDPSPDTSKPDTSHGTRCAGEIAGKANNGNCGVGVAHGCKIGGIRILDGPVTDSLEAIALNYMNQTVHIYSASWGPRDNGGTMEMPKEATKRALQYGVKYGRGGKGSLYVWASGNGGGNGDCCNADGYVSAPESISIGSINDKGERPYFMELCSSTMAVVTSGGERHMGDSRMYNGLPKIKVVTTDVKGGCILNFEGTSSAAPLAAGALALVLEANGDLTWRDVQHLIAATARIPKAERSKWVQNAGGFHVSYEMGFGVLDIGAMIQTAQYWTNIPERHICVGDIVQVNKTIPLTGCIEHSVSISGCQSDPLRRINWLEHVELSIKLERQHRGDISIYVIAPTTSKTKVLYNRPNDEKSDIDFTFMTVHLWGEHPKGAWTIRVCASKATYQPADPKPGYWHDFKLTLYGMYTSRTTRSTMRKPVTISVKDQRKMIAHERETYRKRNIVKKSVFKKKLEEMKKSDKITENEITEILKELKVDPLHARNLVGGGETLFNAKRNLETARNVDKERTEDRSQDIGKLINQVKKILAEREKSRQEYKLMKERQLHEYINGYRWERVLGSSSSRQGFLDLLDELEYKVNNKH